MEKKKLAYIENLRIFLTILVVLQHAVRAYGAEVWWFIQDGRAPLLERFTAVNSSFFMSLFFFISFYFLPLSYEKKGFFQFHKDRFLRLFVPLMFYVLVLGSPMMYFYFIKFRNYGTPSFLSYFTGYFLGMAGKPSSWTGPSWPDLNFGHLWFIEHLILYGIAYSLYRLVFRAAGTDKARRVSFPNLPAVALFALGVGLVSFLIRTRSPLYRWIGLLGFIQIEPAHFPYYLSMFFIGIHAARNDWLNTLPEKTGWVAFFVGSACAAAIAFFPIDPSFFGGWSIPSFAYTLLETYACFGLSIGLVAVFRKYVDSQSKIRETLSRATYVVYIIHLPVVVALQYALLGFALNPYAKFFLVSIVSFPLVFLLGVLLRKIPYVARYV